MDNISQRLPGSQDAGVMRFARSSLYVARDNGFLTTVAFGAAGVNTDYWFQTALIIGGQAPLGEEMARKGKPSLPFTSIFGYILPFTQPCPKISVCVVITRPDVVK
jgi:hypothetical protein